MLCRTGYCPGYSVGSHRFGALVVVRVARTSLASAPCGARNYSSWKCVVESKDGCKFGSDWCRMELTTGFTIKRRGYEKAVERGIGG